MKLKNTKLAVYILIPILSLLLLTFHKQYKVTFGRKIIIPIEGYDPRDLLSGHYLIYRLSLNITNYSSEKFQNKEVYLYIRQIENDRVESKASLYLDDDELLNYDLYIKGKFHYSRFKAGIERFYIPEKHALKLDKVVRESKGKIIVSVDQNGKAIVKELLINDMPWKKYLKNN